MPDSQDKSTTFSNAEAMLIVTAPADLPAEPYTSLAETDREVQIVASTFEPLSGLAPTPPKSDAICGLTPRDCVLLLCLGSVCLLLSVWHWGQLAGWGMEPVEVNRLPERIYDYRIDLNRATWVELMQLPEIGETLAQRILEHREKHGPFQSVEKLDDVKGIGPKTVEKLRPWLLVEEPKPE